MGFNLNIENSSVPTSMEGIGSSPTRLRSKRNDWLSRSGPRSLLKWMAIILFLSIAIVGFVLITPFVKRMVLKKSLTMPSRALNNNQFFNSTPEPIDLDNILKDYPIEKDNLQACDLKPESRYELGKGTWSLLHIMASTYPEKPSPQVLQEHKLFFQLLPRVYPCPDCRVHMAQMFRDLPPQLNSRTEFVHWLCTAHNRVNLRLGKPLFDCEAHDDRWDCGCNIVPGAPLNAPKEELTKPDPPRTTKKPNKSHKHAPRTVKNKNRKVANGRNINS